MERNAQAGRNAQQASARCNRDAACERSAAARRGPACRSSVQTGCIPQAKRGVSGLQRMHGATRAPCLLFFASRASYLTNENAEACCALFLSGFCTRLRVFQTEMHAVITLLKVLTRSFHALMLWCHCWRQSNSISRRRLAPVWKTRNLIHFRCSKSTHEVNAGCEKPRWESKLGKPRWDEARKRGRGSGCGTGRECKAVNKMRQDGGCRLSKQRRAHGRGPQKQGGEDGRYGRRCKMGVGRGWVGRFKTEAAARNEC